MAPETSERRSGQLELAKVCANVAFVLRRVQRIELPRQRKQVLRECLTSSLQLLEELLDKPVPPKFVLGGGVPLLSRLATRAPAETLPRRHDRQGVHVACDVGGDGGSGQDVQAQDEPEDRAAREPRFGEASPLGPHVDAGCEAATDDAGDEPEDRAVGKSREGGIAEVSPPGPHVDAGCEAATDAGGERGADQELRAKREVAEDTGGAQCCREPGSGNDTSMGGLAAGSGGNHGSYEEPPDVPWWEQKPGSDDSGFTALEPSDIEDFVAWSDAEIARAYAAGEDLPQTREATGFGSQRFGYYTWRNKYKGEVAD